MEKKIKGVRVLSVFEFIIGIICAMISGYFVGAMISAGGGASTAGDAIGYTLGLVLFIYFGIPLLVVGAAMITSFILSIVLTKRGKYLKMRPYFVTYTVLYFVFAAAAILMAVLSKETASTLLWAWVAFIFVLFAVLKLRHAIAIKKLRESETNTSVQAAEINAAETKAETSVTVEAAETKAE